MSNGIWPVPTPTLTTKPTSLPISLDEAKVHLRVDHGDEDALIESLIEAATEWLQAACDRQFCQATYALKLPYFPAYCIEIPYPPLSSVTSITYLDTGGSSQTLSSAYYVVHTTTTPGRVLLADGYTWPSTDTHPEAVTITFVAGSAKAGDIPRMARQALLLLVGHWYEHRESVAAGSLAEVPQTVDFLVQSLRAYRF